jgi:hypothetical protein
MYHNGQWIHHYQIDLVRSMLPQPFRYETRRGSCKVGEMGLNEASLERCGEVEGSILARM